MSLQMSIVNSVKPGAIDIATDNARRLPLVEYARRIRQPRGLFKQMRLCDALAALV